MKKLTATIFALLLPCAASAGVFTANITATDPAGVAQTKAFEFDQAENFFDQLTNKGFTQAFPGYDSTWKVQAVTTYQGVPVNVTLDAGSNKLLLDIPSIGVSQPFDGASRGESTKALENYLRNDTDGVYSKILEYQVASTPNSQIAGNPTSLQGQLVTSTFNNAVNVGSGSTGTSTSSGSTSGSSSGSSSSSSASGSSAAAGSSSGNPVVFGLGGGNYTQKSGNNAALDVSVFNVPISKAFNIDSEDPRKKLLVNAQFNYITVNQSASFQGSLGLGYQHPVTDNWSLIPTVSYGAIGSQDLATLGQIFSSSIASNYQLKTGEVTTGLVNMFGYFKTLPLSIQGVASSDPNINNYVFKNGIFPSKVLPFKVFDHSVKATAILTDTEFLGSKVFVRQYNEVGVEFSSIDSIHWLDRATFGMADSFSLSAKYVFSLEDTNRFQGYEIGLGYSF
ncbi:hypothetical protein JCM14076_19790 [Methylosoma difficile]